MGVREELVFCKHVQESLFTIVTDLAVQRETREQS